MNKKIRHVDYRPDEFLAGTFMLTDAQLGLYWRACTLIYSKGGPIEIDHLRQLSRSRHFDRNLSELVALHKLSRNGTQIDQQRAEAELDNARNRVASLSVAGKKGAKIKWDRYSQAIKNGAEPSPLPENGPDHPSETTEHLCSLTQTRHKRDINVTQNCPITVRSDIELPINQHDNDSLAIFEANGNHKPEEGRKGSGDSDSVKVGESPDRDRESESPAAGAAQIKNIKEVVFRDGLRFFRAHSSRKESSLRSLLGQWCKLYGDGAVLDVMLTVTTQQPTPIDPVSFCYDRLKRDAERFQKTRAAERVLTMAPGP